MHFIITGGGTGGHLVIAKTLAQELKAQGHTPIFIGSTSGQDRAWFEGKNLFSQTHFFKTSGVVNQKGIYKLTALWRIFKAYLQSLMIVKDADAVISVGGFSAAPASFAAITLKKPFFIHEQNATIGRLNKLLKPYTKAFYSSYDSDAALKDYPINQNFFKRARTRDSLKTIIFLGGSQGAHFINELALSLAPTLQEKGIHIIHQCGKYDIEKVAQFYKEQNIDAECFAFSENVIDSIEKADFAIARSGASTLWEIAANGLPALFIPYPYAANDHQYANAQFLVEKKLAYALRESEITQEKVIEILNISDEALQKTSEGLQKIIAPNGTKKIVNSIIKSVEGTQKC